MKLMLKFVAITFASLFILLNQTIHAQAPTTRQAEEPLPNLVSSFNLTPPNPQAGEPVLITVVVTNTGDVPAEPPSDSVAILVDFYINPTIPPITAVDWIALGSSLEPEQGLEWRIGQTLNPDESITFTSEVGEYDEFYSDWAGFFYEGTQDLYTYVDAYATDFDPDGRLFESDETDNSFYRRFDPPLTSPINLNKTADKITAIVGGQIDYTLTLSNSSPISLTALTLSDEIPNGTTYLAQSATDGGLLGDGTIEWTLPHLLPQETKTVSFSVIVTDAVATKQTPRIVGGQDAEPGAYPYQVFISAGFYSCAGTLLSDEWVLTAAHCLYAGECGPRIPDFQISITAGAHNIGTAEATQQEIDVAETIVHPNYICSTNDNDLSLMRLVEPATLNYYVQPISWVTPQEVDLTVPGVEAVTIGWGRTSEGGSTSDILQEVTVPLVSNETCNSKAAYNGLVSDNMMCAGYAEGEQDACSGDSGGPLLVPDGAGGFRQAGITSWGDGCARPNKYGVYTRISNYDTWIEEISGLSAVPMTLTTVVNDNYTVTGANLLLVIKGEPVTTTISSTQTAVMISAAGGRYQLGTTDNITELTIDSTTFANQAATIEYDFAPTDSPAVPLSLIELGMMYELLAYDALDNTPLTPSQPYTITVGYDDLALPPNVSEADLALYFYDEMTQQWVRESSSVVDVVNNHISATPLRLSHWAILIDRATESVYLPLMLK